MTTTQKIGAAVVVVLGLLGALSFFGVNLVAKTESFGSTVSSDIPWFTNGYKVGNSNALYTATSLSLPVGVNQASWLNNTGQIVVVDNSHVDLLGTASTTMKLYVGTSTKSTVTDSFALGTAPMWSQTIDGYSIATSTSGLSATQAFTVADNYGSHKTNYSSFMEVLPNQYLIAVLSSNCSTYSQACGETATSSNRGYTLAIPILYHYSSPN